MPSESDLLRKGVEQFEAGDRPGAARIFVSLLRQDPLLEPAWWWLASCVDSESQRRDCLQRVLEINPWNDQARDALEQLDETPLNPFWLARSAEARRDYEAAYRYYTQAAELDPANVAAWLGKGFSTGMLSGPGQNRVREFFECLGKALRATGMVTGQLQGITPAQLAPRLDAAMTQKLSGYLHALFDYVTGLAERCPPDNANLLHVERVRLADWIQFTQGLADSMGEDFFSREKMFFIALDSYTRIAANIRQATRGPRSRQELLNTFKFFLLSNLSLSKLNQDPDLLGKMEEIQERST